MPTMQDRLRQAERTAATLRETLSQEERAREHLEAEVSRRVDEAINAQATIRQYQRANELFNDILDKIIAVSYGARLDADGRPTTRAGVYMGESTAFPQRSGCPNCTPRPSAEERAEERADRLATELVTTESWLAAVRAVAQFAKKHKAP